MTLLLVRIARWGGWLVLFASLGVVIGTIGWQAARGPVADQSLWPTPRLWRYFGTSLAMAVGATLMALFLALPATLGLLTTKRPWQRGILASLTMLPLLSMPSSFAYAWMLLATSRIPFIEKLMKAIHWNTPGLQPLQSAWVLATWLWPIPCLVLVAAFRHSGSGAYRLACMDAPPTRAFFRGALPTMRGPLMASLAAVFTLSIMDSSIPPLMGATQVWAVEMLAQAAALSRVDRPAAFMFFQSWPMLALILTMALLAIPGLRQMARWSDEADAGDLGASLPASRRIWWIAILITTAITVLPLIVFCVELSTGRTTAGQAIATAWRTLWKPGLATILVAACTGIAAMCLSIALIDDDRQGGPRASTTALRVSSLWHRRLAGAFTASVCRLGFALLIAVAVLPPELTGISLVSFYADLAGPAAWWSPYDRTPWTWIAAMIVRFALIPVICARIMAKRTSADLVAAATVDGATPVQRLVFAKLPAIRRALVAACIIVSCLAMSEVAVSVLVQPPRFFGGSLAVAVDSQMHYGRQNETIAGALILALPAMLVAGAVPLIAGKTRSVGY